MAFIDDGRLLGQYQDAAFTQLVKTYQYDANGNRTQVTDAGSSPLQSLTFDQRGFVSSLSTPASGYTFAYDPLGYRIKRATSGQTNLYMLEGEHLEAIYNQIGELQSSYFRGSLVDEIVNGFSYSGSTKTNFTVHHDHLNSVMALTDHNGQAWQHYEYDPFGQPLMANDPDGEFLHIVFGAVIGGAVGLGAQATADLINGSFGGWDYLGAAVGGATTGGLIAATGGASLLVAGAAGGVGAFTGGVTQQRAEVWSGAQTEFDYSSLALDTTLGALTGGLGSRFPLSSVMPVKGLTNGANSYAAISKSTMTKLRNKTIGYVSSSTMAKSVAADFYQQGGWDVFGSEASEYLDGLLDGYVTQASGSQGMGYSVGGMQYPGFRPEVQLGGVYEK